MWKSACTVELLDARRLLSMASFATLDHGMLRVFGTSAANAIEVRYAGQRIIAELDGESISFNRQRVREVIVDSKGGDDRLGNRTDRPATLRGGQGADVILPGTGGSFLVGDVLDRIDYTNLPATHFDIFTTPTTATEAIATIERSGVVDQFVSVDGRVLNVQLTRFNDAMNL
jgi:hypothetical protein